MCYTYTMELRQKIELRKHLIPELSQSLNILALPLFEVQNLIAEELENNPLLEELSRPASQRSKLVGPDWDFQMDLITQKPTLQDMLLRQLGMFTNTDEEFRIGQEIIGNIDEHGYLKATPEELSASLNMAPEKVEKVLKLVQEFEPAGVCARTLSECLLIQLRLSNQDDPLLLKIVECHLEDLAKKNYSHIAKSLKTPQETLEPLIKKILKLDPKPGSNYSPQEVQRVIPDIFIDTQDEEETLEISINNEDIPSLAISKDYRKMLKNSDTDSKTKEFLTAKLQNAMELLRALSRRQDTLRKIVEAVAEIQKEAMTEDLSRLKPLTFSEVAEKIGMHESTVCRAVMNKYVKTPYAVVALKDFFTSHVHNQDGESVSSNFVKRQIKELIDGENKKQPLSDDDLAKLLSEKNNLKVARRTVAKYREELKILSSIYRKER
ncbi:MAG: RNA polymerase factor sigma-54 [Candidatus Omnitrophota bacterium]